MERIEKEVVPSTQKKELEPTLVPEWLKTAPGASVSNGGSNHLFGSSIHSAGILSRNRLSVNTCDHSHSTVFSERSSLSYRRSSSINGSHSHNKDKSVHIQPYSSFGGSHHHRDKDKDTDSHGRGKSINFENGFPLISNRSEKDTLMRSQSMISGRRSESWSSRTGSDTSFDPSGGSTVGSISKPSFEREFPSLLAEDRRGPPEICRITSPVLSNAVQNLQLGASAIIGGDGWTSALAEVPVIIGGNGPVISSMKQIAPASVSSTVSITTTGLNMAEKLAQAPRASAAPQLSIETRRLEELAIKQSRQLIPMTQTPKASILNSSEKPKPKGSRSGDFNTFSKVGQLSSVQLVNKTPHGYGRSDSSKLSQIGSFQVLNREKNVFSPTASDGPSSTNASRVLNSRGVVPSVATTPPLNNPNNPKAKIDGKANALPLTTAVEKRPVSQQNRSDFFNSLRKKTSANHLICISEASSCQSSTLDGSHGQMIDVSTSADTQAKGTSASHSGLGCSMENGSCTSGVLGDCEEPEAFPTFKKSCLDPAEEVRLLQLFGWKENAGEEDEALTAEEIDAFIKEYQKLRPSSKFCHLNSLLVRTMLPEADDGSSGSESI